MRLIRCVRGVVQSQPASAMRDGTRLTSACQATVAWFQIPDLHADDLLRIGMYLLIQAWTRSSAGSTSESTHWCRQQLLKVYIRLTLSSMRYGPCCSASLGGRYWYDDVTDKITREDGSNFQRPSTIPIATLIASSPGSSAHPSAATSYSSANLEWP